MPAPSLDPYQWYARTVPPIVAFLPVLVVAAMYIGTPVNIAGLILLLSSLGVLFLMSTIARTRGLQVQARLFKKWGGGPAATLLRHGDTALDEVTKARYHRILENRMGIALPDARAELHATEQAHMVYDSCIRWLISQTKDATAFPEVQREVLQYGFHRNAYGIRIEALIVAGTCLVIAVGHIINWSLHIVALPRLTPYEVLAVPVSVAAIAFWWLYITEHIVRTYANEYGRNLLSTLDRPQSGG